MPISDRDHRFIEKLIEQEKPQTLEDLQKLLNSLMGKPLPDHLPGELSIQDQARELAWQAWESPAAKGTKLARQALETDPDCIEAHEYLGNKTSDGQAHFEKAVEIGKRLFGGAFLKQNKGAFWGVTITRPFMRCLHRLAETYQAKGQTAQAIAIWEEMLQLNPGDNQGIRYPLAAAHLEQKDLAKYRKLRKKFQEDSAITYFNDALAAYLENGETDDATGTLKAAFSWNRFVPSFLLAERPPVSLPDSYAWESSEEAVIYAHHAWQAWTKAAGAKHWLKKHWQKESGEENRQAKGEASSEVRLSASDLETLVYQPFSEWSPLKLRPTLTVADVQHVPFFQLCRNFLRDLKAEQPLKLTPKGNLPRKMLRQLYDYRFFPDKYVDDGTVKLLQEADFLPINVAHVLCDLTGLVKKRLGKLSLTKAGEQALQNEVALYHALLKAYCSKYNWAYVTYDPENVVQYGWALTMHLFLKIGGEECNANFFAEHYLDWFPNMLNAFPKNDYFPPERRFLSCFHGRFFNRFCHFFGLAEVRVENEKELPTVFLVKKSALADKVFEAV